MPTESRRSSGQSRSAVDALYESAYPSFAPPTAVVPENSAQGQGKARRTASAPACLINDGREIQPAPKRYTVSNRSDSSCSTAAETHSPSNIGHSEDDSNVFSDVPLLKEAAAILDSGPNRDPVFAEAKPVSSEVVGNAEVSEPIRHTDAMPSFTPVLRKVLRVPREKPEHTKTMGRGQQNFSHFPTNQNMFAPLIEQRT